MEKTQKANTTGNDIHNGKPPGTNSRSGEEVGGLNLMLLASLIKQGVTDGYVTARYYEEGGFTLIKINGNMCNE